MIRRVLLPLDGSAIAECAIPHAAVIAGTFRAPLTVVSVMASERDGSGTASGAASWNLRRAETVAYLDEIAEALRDRGLTVETEVLEGEPAMEIIGAGERWDADLIVLSSHGHGQASTFELGGTVAKVSSRAGVSIMVIRATGADVGRGREFDIRYRRILAPVDCSQRADAGLCMAASIAEANESELLMLAVVKVPVAPRRVPGSSADQALARRLVEANERAAKLYLTEMEQKLANPRLKVRGFVMVSRSIPAALQEVAQREDARLMVLTAHGSSGEADGLYGGVARSLIYQATTPLLVLQDQPKEAFRLPDLELANAERVITSR